MTVSVIIPAHDEETTLGATLDELLRTARSGEFDVIVATNGCTDRTAAVARSFAPQVRLVEVQRASKTAALNAADRSDPRPDRIYLDADVRMPTATARALATVLQAPEPRMVVPTARVDLRGAPWALRAYQEVWYALSAVREDFGGTGVYALNEAARALFDTFPEVIADDLFVHTTCAHHRMRIEAPVLVRPPRTLRDLVAVRTRVYRGNDAQAEVRGVDRAAAPALGGIAALARDPAWWPRLAAFGVVTITAKRRARTTAVRPHGAGWGRDSSTRA